MKLSFSWYIMELLTYFEALLCAMGHSAEMLDSNMCLDSCRFDCGKSLIWRGFAPCTEPVKRGSNF